MKLRWLLSLMLLLLMSPLLVAQDDEKDDAKQDKEPTVAEQFREMKSSFSKEMRSFSTKARKAKENDERMEIFQERTKFAADTAEKMLALVKDSDDKELSANILTWVVQNDRGDSGTAAMDSLLNDFPESKALGSVATTLGRGMPEPKTEAILRKMIESSPHDSVKASATMSLVNMLSSMSRFADMPKAMRASMVERMGEGGEEFLDKWTAEAVSEETIKLLETAMEEYGDVPLGRSTVGETAENKLFSIKYLQIGKVAPDIVGKDLDEVEFKLSDYRGKVVVIDFWGDW